MSDSVTRAEFDAIVERLDKLEASINEIQEAIAKPRCAGKTTVAPNNSSDEFREKLREIVREMRADAQRIHERHLRDFGEEFKIEDD